MIDIVLLPSGNLEIPKPAYGPGIIGDTTEEISPEHPDYQQWKEAYEEQEEFYKKYPEERTTDE